jgi:nucleotide-binding universal stress UspA family protein
MFKRILVPLDGSSLAEAVLSYATILAEHNDAEIVLLHVAEYSSDLYAACYEYPPADPELAARLDEKKKAICLKAMPCLEQLAERLKASGHIVLAKIHQGSVVDAILDCVEDPHTDLIVMSTHARSGYAHQVIGVIADRVMYEPRVKALLVRVNPGVWATNHFRLNGATRAALMN